MMELSPSLAVQLVSCTAACVGFAYWFNVKGIQVMYAGIGAFFTWLAYALLYNAGYSNFMATLVGSIFVAAYAQIMARVNKAPATIFGSFRSNHSSCHLSRDRSWLHSH